MRLFVAALLPEDIRIQLSRFIQSLEPNFEGVRWEKPEKLHVTLKFLGDVDDGRVMDISSMIEKLVQDYSPFKMHLDDFGGFPRLKNPRVLYVGLSQNKELSQFQKELDLSLCDFGFEKEARKFMPHVTIGRVKKKINVQKAPDLVKTSFEINQVGIIKSELRPKGSVYTPLKLFDLK